MWRRFGAVVAVLVLLGGFSAAPYTHAHHTIDSVGDAHHPPGQSLVHTHASSHPDHDAGHPQPEPGDQDESADRIWSVNSFVFQQQAPDHAPLPALVGAGQPHVQLIAIWLGAPRPQPRANGPPTGSPSGSRAPPAFLPLFA
jgi:hypothetical protein